MCFSMASLLSKFRIDYSDLKVIPDITKSPQDETVKSFEAMIKELKVPDEDEDGGKSSHPSVAGLFLYRLPQVLDFARFAVDGENTTKLTPSPSESTQDNHISLLREGVKCKKVPY